MALFKVLIERHDSTDTHNLACIAVPELVSLPKAGKSAGPDHRIALYTMLAALVPAPGVLLAPRASNHHSGSEGATRRSRCAPCGDAGSTHCIPFCEHRRVRYLRKRWHLLRRIWQARSRVVRRAFIGSAGSMFLMTEVVLDTAGGVTLGKALLGSFEACLKTVTANPLGASGGPYEGYVALAVLLGPFARCKLFGLCFHCLSRCDVDRCWTCRYSNSIERSDNRDYDGWHETIVPAMGQSVSETHARGR